MTILKYIILECHAYHNVIKINANKWLIECIQKYQ